MDYSLSAWIMTVRHEHPIYGNQKGGIAMLTSKELMQLEDALNMEQSCVKAFNQFANMTQDNQTKQVLQQLAQKDQQHLQTLKKHLSAGQTLQ